MLQHCNTATNVCLFLINRRLNVGKWKNHFIFQRKIGESFFYQIFFVPLYQIERIHYKY